MIYPAAITPRRTDEVSIDIAAALELIDFLESHGVHGITLLGSTGEFPHFTPEDRIKFAAMAIKRAHVPVLVNASHSALDAAIAIAQAAASDGAAGVLIMPPIYFRYSQDSIRAYMREFAAQVKAPVYLYNIPQFTTGMTRDTVLDLLSTGAFAGIKDSWGDWDDFIALQKAGHKIFTGAEAKYSRMLREGVYGTISGVASAVPELMVEIDRRARAGEETTALDAKVVEFIDRTAAFPCPIGIREAAAIRGLKPGPHATPLSREESARLEEFRDWFKTFLATNQHE